MSKRLLHSIPSQLLCFRCRLSSAPKRYASTTSNFVEGTELPPDYHALMVAAPEIDFSTNPLPRPNSTHARIVPASPSYFTSRPRHTDSLLELQGLLRKYATLPTTEPGQAPRVAWRSMVQYRNIINERISATKYNTLLAVLKRLNQIHPALMPSDLKEAMAPYKRDVNPYDRIRDPGVIDEDGRAYGIGRRKTSSAKVYLVQGTGECLINGQSINDTFGRVHDRESALWPLKATQRLDKYNIWALVTGGGKTGQAEAITLAAARALMVHEPGLKPALRRGTSRSLTFHPLLLFRRSIPASPYGDIS